MNKNIYICSSIYIYRFFILRKKPTLLKLAAAGIVCVGLIMSLIPVIGNMDKDSAAGLWHQQSAAGRILWPLCFMIGFVSYIHDHMITCIACTIWEDCMGIYINFATVIIIVVSGNSHVI